MHIKICGPGCKKCAEAEKIVKETLAESGIAAQVEKVTDFQAIASMGVFATPAVVVDGQIKCVGKVPNKNEVLAWLT